MDLLSDDSYDHLAVKRSLEHHILSTTLPPVPQYRPLGNGTPPDYNDSTSTSKVAIINSYMSRLDPTIVDACPICNTTPH